MHKMTEQHLIDAFGAESQAHVRYLHFADTARQEGFPQVERLFRATAYAEFVHASDHYRELKHLKGGFVANAMAAFGPGTTRKNLELSIAGEDFEINEMYPAYIEVAASQKESGALRSFQWAFGTEIRHKLFFARAKAAVEAGKDMIHLGVLHVCEVCGYTVEGPVPDKCPLCGVAKDRFVTFEQKGRA